MAAEDKPEAKTYQGGCHCGAVRYEVTMPLESVLECNCSHCAKKGFLLAFTGPENFKLVAGDEVDTQTTYKFATKRLNHFFCKTCGVQSYGRGPGRDPATTVCAINVRCLDGVEAASLPVRHHDGKSHAA